MKRLGRVAFFTGMAVIWLAVVLLALEAYQALRWRGIERSNPFIQARQGLIPWLTGDPQETPSIPVPEAPIPADSGRAVRAPLPDPKAELLRRMEYFAFLDPTGQDTFCNTYGLVILQFRPVEKLVYVRAPFKNDGPADTVARLCGGPERVATIREHVPRSFETGETALVRDPLSRGKEEARYIGFMPMKDATGAIDTVAVFADPLESLLPPPPPESLWERPFFIYKKHACQNASKQAYGTVAEFRTNNYGFRDDDVVLPKPPGVYRILCVGASTTEEGSSNASTYPNRLEKKLNEAFGTTRIDVINCGISGLNTTKERMRLPDYLALEPDLILCYNAVNDLCHELFPHWVREVKFWQKLLRQSRFLNNHINRWLLPNSSAMRDGLESSTFYNFRAIYEYAHAHGVAMAFCSFAAPDLASLTRDERDYYDFWNEQKWGGRYVTFASYCRALDILNAQLKKMCDGMGIPYIPVAEHVKDGTLYFGDICHMRDKGIALKVDTIAEALKDPFGDAIRRAVTANPEPAPGS